MENTQRVDSLSMAQGGDFIGGENSTTAVRGRPLRKCMNSFLCRVERPFQFLGRINEDVNTYTYSASKGLLLFTTPMLCLNQAQTQSQDGGMSDIYNANGTYLKSFYTVMFMPSAVKISVMGTTGKRIHHRINWNNCVPKVISEEHKNE